jgi:hypothetical protein
VRFSHTGDEPALFGERPGAGIDWESDNGSDHFQGLTFTDCETDNNLGASYINGSNVGKGGGAGCVFDYTGGPDGQFIKLLRHYSHDNNFTGIGFNLRGDADQSNTIVEDCVIEGNAGSANSQLRFSSTSGSTGHYTSATVDNCDCHTILFSTNLPSSGHSVTIWRGNFSPTITTNGKATISINNGFPP